MKKMLSNAITGLLVVCALLVTVAVARREFMAASPAPSASAPAEPRPITDWRDLTNDGLWMGSKSASVTLVEFADFQCPFCAVEAANLREVLSHYGSDVAVVFRHFPLEHMHPHAYEAAVAAECAAAQESFGAFHDVLFDEQDAIGTKPWSHFAAAVGIDTARFSECMSEEWPRDRVEEDAKVARKIGLTGTPSVIVDGLLLPGTPSVETLRDHIDRALAGSKNATPEEVSEVAWGPVSDTLRPWASGPWLEVDETQTAATEQDFLAWLGTVNVDPSGRVYVLERHRKELLVLDADLQHRRTVDLSAFGERVVSARVHGDSIVVFDSDSEQVATATSRDGALIRRSRVPGFGQYSPYAIWKLERTAGFVAAYSRATSREDAAPDAPPRAYIVGLVAPQALFADSLLSVPASEMLIAVSDVSFSVQSHPFGRKSYVELLAGDRLVHALSDALAVTIVNLETGISSEFGYDAHSLPVSDDEVQQAASTLSDAAADVLREGGPYEHPVLPGLVVDNQRELIWIGIQTQPESVEWAAFDPSGGHRASLLLPNNEVLVGAWEDRLLAIEHSERRPYYPVLKSYLLRTQIPM